MRRLLATLGACAVVGAALADTPPPPPLEKLVSQLGSPAYAEREAAGRALEKAGPAAAPLLEAATRHADPEVRRRAADVLGRIRRAADTATRLSAPTTALSYQNVPLAVAVHDLAARTKLPLVLDADRVADVRRPVSVSTGEQPVWEAVEQFCRAAGLREGFVAELEVPKPKNPKGSLYVVPPPPAPMPGEVAVTLIDGPPDRLPADRGTAVRVVALPASFPKNRVVLGTGDLTLHLDVAPVPAMNWQDTLGVRVTRAADDRGRPATGAVGGEHEWRPLDQLDKLKEQLNALAELNPPDVPSSVPNPRVVPVRLKLAGPGARALAVLEGRVTGEVVIPHQPLVTVADPGKLVGSTLSGPNGVHLTVLDFQRTTTGVVTVRARVQSPSAWTVVRKSIAWGPAWPETNRPGAVPPKLQGYDAAGNPVSGASSAPHSETSDDQAVLTQTFTMVYRPDRVPAKLVVLGPRTIAVEVPFRLENVPLP
jgi:hypothetical protein